MTQLITGHTRFIAHLGTPTHSFKAPMIYNPYFEEAGIDAVVIPMDCAAGDFAELLPVLFRMGNIAGALITMPHKVPVVDLLDEVSPTVRVCGACNAVKRDASGRLIGDMFDGEGFVRGIDRKGYPAAGRSALVIGSGGVGSAIAASLANAGAARLGVCDLDAARADELADRLRSAFPQCPVETGSNDPAGWDIVVNATPLGMAADDGLPCDVSRLSPETFVGEVVMKAEATPFLEAARAVGCPTQIGTDMLFEQIPAYLEFFDLPSTTAEELRRTARIQY